MKKFFIVIVSFVFLMSFSSVFAQNNDDDLEGTLEKLSEDAAKSYVGPIVTAFGMNLNGGWFHKAPRATKFNLDIEVGLVVMATMFSDEDKTFSANGSFRFNESQAEMLAADVDLSSYPSAVRQQIRDAIVDEIIQRYFNVGISGPTVVGSEDENVMINFPSTNLSFTHPVSSATETVTVPAENIELPVTGLLDEVAALPLAAPQLSVGTVFGTMAKIRYLPTTEIDEEIGELEYFGFGIQHNPKAWLKYPLPFDMAISYFTQTLKVGTVLEAKTTSFGINASKTIGFAGLNFAPYFGWMSETSELTFTYNYQLDSPTGPIDQEISFEMEGENKSRITLGLSFRLLLFNAYADYNIGEYKSYCAGLSFGF